jgi:hypothetical protein
MKRSCKSSVERVAKFPIASERGGLEIERTHRTGRGIIEPIFGRIDANLSGDLFRGFTFVNAWPPCWFTLAHGRKAKSPVLDGLERRAALPPPRTGDSRWFKLIMAHLSHISPQPVNKLFFRHIPDEGGNHGFDKLFCHSQLQGLSHVLARRDKNAGRDWEFMAEELSTSKSGFIIVGYDNCSLDSISSESGSGLDNASVTTWTA